jgi:hypothetical protein
MKTNRFRNFLWAAPIVMILLMWQLPAHLRAQAGGQFNVSKDIMDHKGILNWKPAGNGIPSDVCTILQVCNGDTKVVALPRATENGLPIARGVFLTQDAKHMDVLVLERQSTADIYFFLLTPQGTLAKAAYAQVGGTSWIPMGMALADPTFKKDAVVWHTWASKLASGPATAATDKKPEA